MPSSSHAPKIPIRAGWYQPLVLVLSALAAGIVTDRLLPLPAVGWWCLAAGLQLAWLIAWRYRFEVAGSGLLLSAVLAAGGAWHHDRWNLYALDEIGLSLREEIRPIAVEGVAVNSPRWVPAPPLTSLRTIPKGDETELMLRITRVRRGQEWESASGWGTLDVDGHVLGVRSGDTLRVMALSSRPQHPLNPGQFDFAAYERSRRVFCKLRGLFPESVTLVDRGSPWSPRLWLSEIRERGNGLLRGNISPRPSQPRF